uniref:Secreted protein n=2 Tax=Heterorhabditis bacteriophora TaxID=37862 RepID=A0A1I7XJH3_HETBA
MLINILISLGYWKVLLVLQRSRDYRKDRPNNPSAKRGQPSINCQGHSQRNESLSRMLTECQINSSTSGRIWIKWTNNQEMQKHPILRNQLCLGSNSGPTL